MNKICTSIEQSQKLIDLGIDVNTADMYHAPDANVIVAEPYIMKTEDETLVPAYKGAIPAWSLTALLELMPTFTLNGFGNGQFNCRDERANNYALVDTCPLDAAFEMICWLKKWKIMKQEDKELLLKDLSARLPYGVMVKVVGTNNPPEKVLKIGLDLPNPYITTETWAMCYPLDVRPYLRPMSSMTEEEYEQYRKFSYYGAVGYRDNDYKEMVATPSFEKVDFLNAHHFDYRGLIEKGLALEASEEMY